MCLFLELRPLVRALAAGCAHLALENLVLRQQLNVLRLSAKHVRLHHGDRLFWVLIHRPGSRDVGPFPGLLPKRDQLDVTDKPLRVSEAGDRLVRTLLVQCTRHILGRSGAPSDLAPWRAHRSSRR